jgi:hypothetical protein
VTLVIVTWRRPVSTRPRRRQPAKARVTVARDAPARLASSVCDRGTATTISSPLALPCRSARSSSSRAMRCGPVCTERLRSIAAASPQRWVTMRR